MSQPPQTLAMRETHTTRWIVSSQILDTNFRDVDSARGGKSARWQKLISSRGLNQRARLVKPNSRLG